MRRSFLLSQHHYLPLFYILAWRASRHRMSAAFHKMDLCQLSHSDVSAIASLCREESNNIVYNLSPVVPVYITLFPTFLPLLSSHGSENIMKMF